MQIWKLKFFENSFKFKIWFQKRAQTREREREILLLDNFGFWNGKLLFLFWFQASVKFRLEQLKSVFEFHETTFFTQLFCSKTQQLHFVELYLNRPTSFHSNICTTKISLARYFRQVEFFRLLTLCLKCKPSKCGIKLQGSLQWQNIFLKPPLPPPP